jgi:hypothetical protein
MAVAQGGIGLAVAWAALGAGMALGLYDAAFAALAGLYAASPLIFGLLIDWLGVGALAVSSGISIAALLALIGLRAQASPAAVPSRV